MTKTTKEFDEAYKKLNAEQCLAVDTIEGPVMLVAGPGTGKTQTLALRIANIIRKTDTPASSILALTYTESGARAMKSRLTSMIGSEAYYANISTFHAFCQGVIKDNPDVFTLNPSSEPLSDLEKLKLIRTLIDNSSLTVLRPTGAPYHYASAILSAVSDLKREGVDPDEFEELLIVEELFLKSDDVSELKKTEISKRQRNLAKNKELNLLFRKYQSVLKSEGSFDFEDMITSVVDAFKQNEELLFSCQEKYLYILVDEYQDTNSAQNELMLLLAKYWGEQANVFVTGDPDQCLPGDTLIATENGEIPIKNVQIGDKVLSAVGKGYTSYVPVTNTFKNKRLAKMITLSLETGQVITSTHNHKMFCYIPPREQTNYWYVYLMFKKGLGWRIGTTIGLSHRLKLEADADKIVGIKKCDSEAEARYFELVYSLKYQIPTVIFKFRNNMISGEWLTRLYKEFDTVANAKKLANDLGINLDEPHYQRDGTTFGKGRTKINLYMNSRSYRTKYDKDGLLKSPSIEHELDIQTKNPEVLRILEEKGFKLRNQNIGKGFRLVSHDLSYLYKIGKELEGELDGILDIKSSLGTHAIQHKPTRIMQAGNVLEGNYLPVRVGNHIEYSKVIGKTEKFEEITTYDLEVYPSHNFIANGVVVHNSIMRFQGASIENQLSFVKAYPNATVITLKQNYRSTQNVLDAADSLITHNNLRINDVVQDIDPHLNSQIGAGDKIGIAELSGNTAEIIFIAEDIKRKIESGVAPSDIAVIYHKNFESNAIADILSKYGIDYTVQGGANVLSDPTVRNFIKILKVIYEMRESREDEDLFTILHYDIFGIDPLDVLKISRSAGSSRLTLFDILGNLDSLSLLDLSSRKQIDETFTKLKNWSALDANKTFVEFFEKF
jgi:DNA helicase-2/ATP-dependent DNA helicase PcrA